jgi:hypothetical protein
MCNAQEFEARVGHAIDIGRHHRLRLGVDQNQD